MSPIRSTLFLLSLCAVISAQNVYDITTTSQTYNYTTNAYTGSSSLDGVAFRFTAPAPGAYSIIVEDVESTNKYIINYTNDNTFSSWLDYAGPATGRVANSFTATATGENHYFLIYAGTTTANNFTIRYDTAPMLTVTNDGNGTTTPSGPATAASGVAQTIYAYCNTGYRWNNWSVISGNPTIADATAYSTTVTITNDATIQANFTAGTLNAITNTATTYNFNDDFYSGRYAGELGVGFTFTAPAAGGYSIVVDDVQSSYKYLRHYTNGNFTSYTEYEYDTGPVTLLFGASAANEVHYFTVCPSGSSYYTNDFTIRYDTALMLTVNSDGNGTTTPSGANAALSGIARSISATPNTGYRWNNWTVTAGNAAFGDATAYSTTVSITNDAEIQANFTAGTLNRITATDVSYNYQNDYYDGVSPSTGIAFRFTAPAPGGYAVVLSSTSSFTKYLYYYGTNSRFSSPVSTQTGSGDIRFLFYASAANEEHYFKAIPASSSYWSYDVSIRYETTPTLTILTNGLGTTNPSGGAAITSGTATSISATPLSHIYYFDHWEVVTSQATFGNASSAATTVTVPSGDATIRAVFGAHPVDTLIVQTDGNGYTYPSDTILILQGHDTTVTAMPNGGYVFDAWSTVQGNATFTNASDAATDIDPSGSRATVQANFTVDPNAQPEINISSIDISSHPDICVTASVTDINTGRSIPGLDSSYFELFEDGTSLPFQLTTITDVGGSSVCLVIDKSGSMDGTPVQQAKDAALSYISSMGPLDRCAIVQFESSAALLQEMTADRALLTSVVNAIPTTGGGGTSILSGAYLGAQQLIQETNSRTVIIFSDGSGTGTPDLATVLALAHDNDITYYSIGIGAGAVEYPLEDLADSTGGYFTVAPSAADLAQLYAQIKRDIEAQYIICYQTPDLIFNGDTHEVVASVTLNSSTDYDTTYWNENNLPPEIILTAATQALIGVNQPEGTAITISADITDDGTIAGARLFYRQSGTGPYTDIQMNHQSGDTYAITIPPASVTAPGIDFYIIAADNLGLIGRSPDILNPQVQPWVIPVNNDAPVITHTPFCIPSVADTDIDADITDADGVTHAILYYKRPTEALFSVDTMTHVTGDTYRGTIPAGSFSASGADYYIRAIDSYNVASRDPHSGIYTVTFCATVPPVADAGDDQTVNADATCEGAVVLDGSGSNDPDGGSLTYEWNTPTGTLSGVSPALTGLPDGTHEIILIVTDDDGNTDSDTVDITVVDVTPPMLIEPSDTTVYVSTTQTETDVTLTPPAVDDACSTPAVDSRRDDGADMDDPYPLGTTMVWWRACDDAGNCDSISQQVIVTQNGIPAVSVLSDTTIDEGETLIIAVTTSDPDGVIPEISADDLPGGADFVDNGDGTGQFSWDIGCDDHGAYTVTFQASDGIDSSTAQTNITVRDLNFAPEFDAVDDTSAPENELFTLTLHAEDCDNDDLQFSSISIPSGSDFQDNGNGTATFSWEPDCDDNGFYVLIFEVTDGSVSLRDTILLRILDVNCFNPVITLSEADITAGIHLPISVAVHSEDGDGTTPELSTGSLPDGAVFTPDNDGNGVFTWTPDETGTFEIAIYATDEVDESLRVDTTLSITVVDENFTGPVFQPTSDTIIDENQELALTVTAVDEDGTVPTITGSSLPDDADFTDNEDGTATIIWQPGCNEHGNHTLVVIASDEKFSDTASILVTVRDQNCAPVIAPISDKNVAHGSTVRFSVHATDPDEDGTIPELSVSTELPDYTFTLPGNGSGIFEWEATYESGTYPVTFYASDDFLTGSLTVMIAVDQTGTAEISVDVDGAAIYALPAQACSGTLLGTKDASFTAAPGVCWFRAEAPGYRPTTFTATIFADSTVDVDVSMKPAIPLSLSAPEALQVGNNAELDGSLSFVDFDADGIQDLSVAKDDAISIYLGSDGEEGINYHSTAITLSLPDGIGTTVSHSYTDWDNDGKYECIISNTDGDLYIGQIENEDLLFDSPILSREDETLYLTVTDIDKDNRKDLVVVSAGSGLYLYLNSGTDDNPQFDDPFEALDGSGNSITDLQSTAVLWDVDNDGWNDLIGADDNCFRLYSSKNDSSLRDLPSGEDLNAGGGRIANASSAAILIIPGSLPKIVVLNEGAAFAYTMRLLGDVTGDGLVNIADIARISKAWETVESDEGWNPALNLRLSKDGDEEVIDIKDISKAAKNWEMEE